MKKRLIVSIMVIVAIACSLSACTQSKNSVEHHDSFSPIDVEDNKVSTNTDDNTVSNNTDDNTDDYSNESIDSNNTEINTETSVEFIQPDVDFAKQYADVVLNAIDTIISYEGSNSVISKLDIGDTISNELVINIVNQAALDHDYTEYELVSIEESEYQDVYIVRLDYDYWIIFLDKNNNSASGYHDGTGTLATMSGEYEEDIEYEDWE